jgi:hypothetical protein
MLKRIEHFQWIYDHLNVLGKKYYLEIEWYDDNQFISKSVALKEIEDSKKELEHITLPFPLRLEHRLCHLLRGLISK